MNSEIELIEELKSCFIAKVKIDEDWRTSETYAEIEYQNGITKSIHYKEDTDGNYIY